MSLSLYLVSEEYETECICPDCEHKHTRMITDEYFDGNITHNLNTMADRAGLYEALWQSKENGFTKAKQIINSLKTGLSLLKEKPEYFKKFNPENGFGSYDGLFKFVSNYLNACKEYPESNIKADK